MTDTEITDAFCEILNGLTIGEILSGDIDDDEEHTDLLAAIIAARQAAYRLWNHFAPIKVGA